MRIQTLDELREEAQISQRLWVKVLGMLEQNWCVIEEGPGGGVELVFFDDHGKVFDHLPAANLHAAQAALQAVAGGAIVMVALIANAAAALHSRERH